MNMNPSQFHHLLRSFRESFNLGQNEGIYFSDSYWIAACRSISMSARILANFM